MVFLNIFSSFVLCQMSLEFPPFKIFNSNASSLRMCLKVNMILLDMLQIFFCFFTLNYFVVFLTSVWRAGPAE